LRIQLTIGFIGAQPIAELQKRAHLHPRPGSQHCAGGPGPNSFGGPITAALERWVEQGSAPDKIIATKIKVDGNPASGVARTRPLCPYPQVARYSGSGSIDDAANFACVVPTP
jgi:hypothetical protein